MTQKYINSFMVDNKSPKTTMYNHFNPNTQTISSPKKNEQAHYNILGMYPNLILQPNFCQNILLLGAVFVFHDESSENQQAAAMADLPLPSQSQVLLHFLQSSFSLHLLLSSLSSSLMTELDLDLHPTSTNAVSRTLVDMGTLQKMANPCNIGAYEFMTLQYLFSPSKSTNKLYSFWTTRVWHDFSQVYIVHYI